MYIEIKELADIESCLIKSGFAKQNSFIWSGDLGFMGGSFGGGSTGGGGSTSGW